MALGAAVVVQLWSLAPVAASVIYCIGDDGHSGFEVVKAGSRGCDSCCHDSNNAPHAGEAMRAGERIDGAPSECTDIALSPAAGIAGKASAKSPAPFVAIALSAVELPQRTWQLRETVFNPPRGSTTCMLRRTVLLI